MLPVPTRYSQYLPTTLQVRTTPELASPEELTENLLRAEGTLLAALLSYNGIT